MGRSVKDKMADWLRICYAIRDAGGSIKDSRGRAVSKLAEITGFSTTYLGPVIRSMEEQGVLARDVKERCNYEICLVGIPDEWEQEYGKYVVTVDLIDIEQEPSPEVVVEEPVEEPHNEDEVLLVPAETDIYDADAVANALIRQVVDILNRDAADSGIEEQYQAMSRRLASVLEDNQRYRTRVRDLEDELALYKQRNSRLAMEKTELQRNLEAALKNNAINISAEARRELEKVMRQAPTTKGD